MPGDIKVEILFRKAVYVLTGVQCTRLLACMDADYELGQVLVVLREDLRKALAGETEAAENENPFHDESEDPPVPWEKADARHSTPDAREVVKNVVKNVAAENEEACGDCRVPRCRFCDQPGTRAGGLKDGTGRTVERYYVCKTAGCIASKMKTPQPMALFAGGN